MRALLGARSRALSYTSQSSKIGIQAGAHVLVDLPHRAVVGVRGPDALKFLQGYTTNDVRRLAKEGDSQFTCVLNGKGRTLAEASLSLASGAQAAPGSGASSGPTVLVDVDAACKDALLAHLRTYKLRAKVELLDLSASHAVRAILPSDPFSLHGGYKPRLGAAGAAAMEGARSGLAGEGGGGAAALGGDAGAVMAHARHACAQGPASAPFAVFVDPRVSRLGVRVLAPREVGLDSLGVPTAPWVDYAALRLLLGVPEGREVSDMVPLEWNLTLLRGVAFDKGCYLGQELVARTHHRGLVRKRFVPVYLTAAGAPPRPPACADPIAAMLVRHTDAAMARHSVKAGGWGHGQGHGPAQTHDFPQSQASGHSQPHHRIQAGSHAPSAAPDAGAAGGSDHHRVRLPFPFLDRDWRGHVEAGAPIEAHAVQPGESVGRVGKLVACVPGLNLALAQLRLEHVAHTLPRPAPSEEGEAAGRLAAGVNRETLPSFDEAAARAAGGAGAEEGEGSDAAASAHSHLVSAVNGADAGEDYAGDEALVAAVRAVHDRAGSRALDFRVGGSSAGGEPTQAYRAVPVLPLWWRHIAHAGALEMAVRTAPGA